MTLKRTPSIRTIPATLLIVFLLFADFAAAEDPVRTPPGVPDSDIVKGPALPACPHEVTVDRATGPLPLPPVKKEYNNVAGHDEVHIYILDPTATTDGGAYFDIYTAACAVLSQVLDTIDGVIAKAEDCSAKPTPEEVVVCLAS